MSPKNEASLYGLYATCRKGLNERVGVRWLVNGRREPYGRREDREVGPPRRRVPRLARSELMWPGGTRTCCEAGQVPRLVK